MNPQDDSCPNCGEANGTGMPCNPCFVYCFEHPDHSHHPDKGCDLCEAEDLLHEMTEDGRVHVKSIDLEIAREALQSTPTGQSVLDIFPNFAVSFMIAYENKLRERERVGVL